VAAGIFTIALIMVIAVLIYALRKNANQRVSSSKPIVTVEDKD
jgi:cbb3-type cytochrome oxidase subunit 3